MSLFHVALVQQPAVPNGPAQNLSLALRHIAAAHSMGADLVLFPEMWSNAYAPPFASAFDAPFHPNFVAQREAWLNAAVERDGAYIAAIRGLAKELEIGVVATYLSKTSGKPQNTALVIGRGGEILLEYAKVHTCDFSLEALLQSGDAFHVCDFDGVRLGVMICFDREFPESARALMLQGAELIMVPNACDMNPARLAQLSTRAFENMVGIAMANYPGVGWGSSCAFSPIVFNALGDWVDNTIVRADDSSQTLMVTFDLDAIRAYRKQEVWGNAYRKPCAYSGLTRTDVAEPFVRAPLTK